jgi:uncharacterized RDD family membrane protein YckC
MTAITVLKENVPQGPFTRSEVADRLNRGEFTLDSLAFVEGLSQWTPLRDVLAKVDAAAPTPQAAPAPVVASMPIVSGYGPTASQIPAGAIGTGYSYATTMQPPGHLVYAGFWLRFAALLIDGIIMLPLILPYFGAILFMDAVDNDTLKVIAGILVVLCWLLVFVGQWLYFAMLESGKSQATVGKRLLGLQVTDRQGARIGFGRATGRYFAKLISALPFEIGFMMAGWTARKQALHDIIADTLVVRQPVA